MRYYIRCRICKQEFDSLEEAEFHAENDHQDQEAVLEFVEELSQQLEGFEHYELKQYPYLYFKREPLVVFDSKLQKYYTLKDIDDILKHPFSVAILTLLKYLDFQRRSDLKNKNERELVKLAKEDALSVLVSEYFKNPQEIERLERQYNHLMSDLVETLEGHGDFCKLCGDKAFNYDKYLWQRYYVEKFNMDKKYSVTSPSKFFLTFVVNRKKNRVQAQRLMHILTKHRSLLKTSVEIGLIDGIQDLLKAIEGTKERQEKQREEEMLSAFLRTRSEQKPIHVKKETEQLTDKEMKMLRWLKSRPKVGEQ